MVDITSGKFVFTCTEAYKIENGKVTNPVKGATLIGNGPDVLKRVKMVGNDSKMDTGIGTCGKDGQSVPVGVGQPTIVDRKSYCWRYGDSLAYLSFLILPIRFSQYFFQNFSTSISWNFIDKIY